MIRVENLSKSFGGITAMDNVTAEIQNSSIFGLIGSNGAGKSTLMRLLCGIYRPDSGTVTIDGEEVYENTKVKERIFYISDDQYYFHNGNMDDLAKYYSLIYPKFSFEEYNKLREAFKLDGRRKLSTFSKGMQKQAHIVLALASNTDYLLCDETFDGLDPVMRQAVKKLLAEAVIERDLTPIIASHNLRELEDICDHVGLLHEGGIIFNQEIDNLRLGTHKIQCAFKEPKAKEDFKGLDILHYENYGSLSVMIIRGSVERTQKVIDKFAPLYSEVVPMSLEEIFISEMEVRGYDSEGINL